MPFPYPNLRPWSKKDGKMAGCITEINGFAEISKWISANQSFNLLECEGNLYFIFGLVGGLRFLLAKWVLVSSIPVVKLTYMYRVKTVVSELPHRDASMNGLV